MEKTLILIKPDGIERKLAGLCLTKLENLEMEIVSAKVIKVGEKLVRTHYAHLKERPFFEELISEMAGHKVLAFILQGKNIVARTRKLVGFTNPEKALPGTIRNRFGRVKNGRIENVIHASSSISDAKREIKLWFSTKEILK